MKINRIIVTLLVAVGYAVALPRVPWLTARALVSTLTLAILFGLWALLQRAWADVAIASAIALGFAVGKFLLPAADALLVVLVTAAVMAFGFLNFTLLIGPWSWFFRRRFLRLQKHRRHVGVASLLLALLHVNIVLAAYYNNQLTAALQAGANVFGATALYLMELLGLTSWKWAQRQISLRWWNVIHAGSLVPYLSLVGYAWTRSPAVLQPWEKFTLAVIAGYWLLLTPTVASRVLDQAVNGWKQLHRLVYAAYAAAVIHVWTGIVAQRSWLTQVIFWVPVALVVGSHLMGRIRRWRARAAQRQSAVLPVSVSNVTSNGEPRNPQLPATTSH